MEIFNLCYKNVNFQMKFYYTKLILVVVLLDKANEKDRMFRIRR